MKKHLLLFLLSITGSLIFNLETFAQEILTENKLVLLELNELYNESHLFYHDETGNATLVINDSDFVNVNQYDKNWNFISNTETSKPTYGAIYLGATLSDKGISAKYVDLKRDNLISLDVLNNKISTKAIKFRENEIAGTVANDSVLVLLTIEAKTSLITAHIFDKDGSIESKDFDFSKIRFLNKNREFAPLNEIITDKSNYGNDGYSTFLHEVSPSDLMSFEKAALESKVYLIDDVIYITLDHLRDITSVISLNIKTGKRGFKQLEHSTSKKCAKSSLLSSNSFLSNNFLFQIAICGKGLTISIKDLTTGKEIQNYSENAKNPFSIQMGDPVSIIKEINAISFTHKGVDLQDNFMDVLGINLIDGGYASIVPYSIGNFIYLKIGGIMITQNITDASAIMSVAFNNMQLRSDKVHPYLQKSRFFYSRIDKDTFKPTISDNLNTYDPVLKMSELFNQDKLEDAKAVNALIFDDHSILGYYQNSKYTIMKVSH